MLSNVTTSLLGKLKATLKKYQDRDILNLIRSQANIKNELLTQFRDISQVCHRTPFFVISGLISVFRSIMKCGSRTLSTSCSSSIWLPCQQISRSSSQMRTHARTLLKLKVLERSLLSIFFMRYVYDLYCTPVILTWEYNHSAWTFLWIRHTRCYSSVLLLVCRSHLDSIRSPWR